MQISKSKHTQLSAALINMRTSGVITDSEYTSIQKRLDDSVNKKECSSCNGTGNANFGDMINKNGSCSLCNGTGEI